MSRRTLLAVVLISPLAIGAIAASQTILHVDSSPPGTGGWTSPYADLSVALMDAESISGAKEVWVAAGTYEPTEELGATPDTRTFAMRSLTRVFGGFAGTETLLPQRNPLLNETILDGEIELPRPPSCDDPASGAGDCFTATPGIPTCTVPECCGPVCSIVPSCCNIAWNADCVEYAEAICTTDDPETIRVGTVVRAVGVSVDSEINGVVVTRGSSPGGSGAGVLVSNGTFRMVRCSIVDNEAASGAGCMFVNTQSERGEVLNCRFEANHATVNGAGLSFRGEMIIANCVFVGNTADVAGGGLRDTSTTALIARQAINCTFSGNVAAAGGAIDATAGLNIRNIIAWGNSTATGGVSEISGSPTVNYSDVRGGWSGAGGTGNISADPAFVAAGSGDVRLLSTSPCIDAGDGTVSTTQLVQDDNDIDEDSDSSERLPDADLDARVINGKPSACTEKIDMGAYEFDPCPSDIDGDGSIDGGDLGLVLAAYGQCQSCPEDVNSDGAVNGADLGLVLAGWGECDDGCTGGSSMAFFGGDEAASEGAGSTTPTEAAELLGFESVSEFIAWIAGLDAEDLATLFAELFGT